MPADAQDIAVLRFVIREGFSADLADLLHLSLDEAVRDTKRGGGDAPHRTHFSHT